MTRASGVGVLAALVVAAACTSDESAPSTLASTTPEPATTVPPTTDAPLPSVAPTLAARIPADDITLEGDLYVPDGKGPHPGIVLIHGSGPQSREERLPGQLNIQFGFSIPVFRQLAEGMRAAGYAVLVYDKRTCGAWNGCADNDYPPPDGDLTIETLIADAAAALAYLEERPEIDPQRIVALGHSQGGQFVPQLVNEGDGRAAGVMLATPHDPPDALVAQQAASTRELLADLGMPSDQIEQAARPLIAASDALAQVRAGMAVTEPILGAPPSFWQSWIDYADAVPGVAADSARPFLVLSGELDWNVPPDQTAQWEATLPAGVGHETTVVPCVTHALNCLSESNPAAITPADIGRSVDPVVIETIVSYLDATLD